MDEKNVKLFRKMLEDRKKWYKKLVSTSPATHQTVYQAISSAYADVLELFDYLITADEESLKKWDYFGEEKECGRTE